MKHELLNITEAQEVLDTKTYTSDKTTGDGDGSKVDGQNTKSLVLEFILGNYTDGTHDFTVQHAEDDGTGSADTWEDIESTSDGELDGSLPSFSESADGGIHRVGVYTNRRFVRVTTSTDGTSSGATYGVYALMDALRYDNSGRNPATNSET